MTYLVDTVQRFIPAFALGLTHPIKRADLFVVKAAAAANHLMAKKDGKWMPDRDFRGGPACLWAA
jgi:hypothetical protein